MTARVGGSARVPAVVILSGVLVVASGLWLLRDTADDAASRPAAHPTPTVSSTLSVAGPSPPSADAEAAKATARDFVVALFHDDVGRMRRLATPRYADRLAAPAASGGSAVEESSEQVRVVAVQTEGVRSDLALLQVLVEREARAGGGSEHSRLELVNVVVVRVGRGWRVDDASF